MENLLTDEEYEKFHKTLLGESVKRYWISWYQPTEDYRPIYKGDKEPLNHLYWCTGQRCGGDNAFTVCAVVDAENVEEAKKTVQKYWPEANEWRFIEEKEPTYLPSEDRFPRNQNEQS